MKAVDTPPIPVRMVLLTFLVLSIGLIYCGHKLAEQEFGFTIARTTPPSEVAIELTEAELAELTEAYESGFDHPDPAGGNDPCERLRLLPYKKLRAWRKQFRKRGFTMDKIKNILKNGRREAFTHPKKGLTYTKIYDQQGNWIVVDFVDCLIWQVAPYNFK